MLVEFFYLCFFGRPTHKIFQAFVFKSSHIVSCKMTHTNPMIVIWFRPTNINIRKCNHNTRMMIKDNTKTPPLGFTSFDSCQKPSPTINIFTLIQIKSKWEQLIIFITPHDNHYNTFILFIQACTINSQNWATILKALNRRMKFPKDSLEHLFILPITYECFKNYNASWIRLL